MKKDYTYAIRAAVVLSAAGVYYYTKKRRAEKAQAEQEAELERAKAQQPVQQKNVKTSVVLTPYQRKVIDLQTFLGVAVDGKAGPQTNMALQKRAPLAYKTYGAIAPTNVDYYKALLSGPKNLIM